MPKTGQRTQSAEVTSAQGSHTIILTDFNQITQFLNLSWF